MKLLPLVIVALGLASFADSPLLAQESTCHSLVIRVESTFPPTDLVRARIFARPSSPDDKVFMVFGNDEKPLEINCGDDSAYNNPTSGLTNEGIASSNSQFVNDSYVTLGQFEKTNSTNGGTNTITATALYPLGSQEAANTLFSVFADTDDDTPSSFSYNGNQEIGWGIDSVSTPALGFNSVPDSEGLVALAQITLRSGSPLSGMLNFKVQPNGESILPTEIASIAFNIGAVYLGLDETFGNTTGGTAGCTDEDACNYTVEACIEDGSCEYLSCVGCTDVGACNYDDEAIADDGSCEFVSCQGCTDETACNYNAEALIDDGTCLLPGCTNECACNFNPNACEDDGSCTFEDAIGNCGGDCLQDVDGNGVCDDAEILGCTVEEACNFDDSATLNDGTCDFLSCLTFGCTDPTACNYDDEATVDNGTCAELDDCEVCGGPGEVYQCGCHNIPEGDCDCNGNQLDALGVCGGDCLADDDGDGFCDAVQGCTYSSAGNYDPNATLDDGSCVSGCSGDIDGDGQRDLTDLLAILSVYNLPCPD